MKRERCDLRARMQASLDVHLRVHAGAIQMPRRCRAPEPGLRRDGMQVRVAEFRLDVVLAEHDGIQDGQTAEYRHGLVTCYRKSKNNSYTRAIASIRPPLTNPPPHKQ